MGKPREKYLARSNIKDTRPERAAVNPAPLKKYDRTKFAVTVERPIMLNTRDFSAYDDKIDDVLGGVTRKLPKRLKSKNYKTFSCFKITAPENLVLTQIQPAVIAEQSLHMPVGKRRSLMESLAVMLQERLFLNLIENDIPPSLPVRFSQLRVAPYRMPMTLEERPASLTVTSTPDGWRGIKANYLSEDPGIKALGVLASEHRISKQAIFSESIYLDEADAVTDPLTIVVKREGMEKDDELRRMRIGMEKAKVLPLNGIILDPIVKLYEYKGPKVRQLDAWPVRELVNCNPLSFEDIPLPEDIAPLALAA